MKHQKHYDNSSMSIQIKFKKEECELNETDVNGNDNKFINSELEASQCHGHMTSPEKKLSESQTTFVKSLRIKKQNGRKLSPLRISKARLPSFPETNKDNKNASSLHQNSKPGKSAKEQSIFKTEEKCKNIFSDFSMSHFSEMRHARTDISVKIGGPNKNREMTDKQKKQQQKYPKLQVSLTLNEKEHEKDLMSMTESDSVTRDNMTGNPQSLSIRVCQYDTSDDNSESKSKSQNGTESDNFYCSSSQEEGQLTGDRIPQLSPISNNRADNFYMLPSLQYLLQPPVLTPISEDLPVRTENDKSFFRFKTETNTQESSMVCTSQQKSNSSLTPVHVSAVKEALKRTCHALESTCDEKIIYDFKDRNILLQRSDKVLGKRHEKNVSDKLKSRSFHDSLKTLDNAEKLTTEKNNNPQELLALSTKDSYMNCSHGENSIQKDITRNKTTLRDGSTARNDTENVCNVDSKKTNSKSNEIKEAVIQVLNGDDENSQLKRTTQSLGSVDPTLMHSEVTSLRQSELILSSLDAQLATNIGSLNSVHAETKPNITESQSAPSSVASNTLTEDCKYSTSLERECCDGSVENPNGEQMRSIQPAFPTQDTHKKEPDKISFACNPVASKDAFKPFLTEQVSKPHCSVASTQNQRDLPSSLSSGDVSGLKTASMKPVLYPDIKDKMALLHDSQLTGTASCAETVLKPANSGVVTLGGNPQQLSQSKKNSLPVVETQACAAFEKDLFLDMYIKDESQPQPATPGGNLVNQLQNETSSDIPTQAATKQQSSDDHCDRSLKIPKCSLGSQGQSVTSTFQSKYVEAISRGLKPGMQTLISPRHYKITNTTDSNGLSSETSNLPIRACTISLCDKSHAAGSPKDAFTSTQLSVGRASHIAARDLKAPNTLRSMPANPTTVISVSSTDASVNQTNAHASHLLPQKGNISLNNVRKPSTKLDPDAVKNMSHRIIHHSSRRSICHQKGTAHERDQVSSAYTAQPTAVTITSPPMTSPTMTSPPMTSHAMTSHTSPPMTSPTMTSPSMTSPAMTSPTVTSHAMTSPAMTSHPMTSHPMTSHAITSHPMTSHPMTSHAMTSHPMTPHPMISHPMTSHAMTSHPVTSHPMTSHPMTSHPMTSHAMTSPPMTSHAMTFHPMTSHAITSHPMTSHPMTSHAMTAHPMTPHPMTSHPMTSHAMTSHPVTSHPMTSHPMTSHPMTSHAMTSPPMTSRAMTSHPMTSPVVTSHPMTSHPMTSHTSPAMISRAMTSHAMTSLPMTSHAMTSHTSPPMTSHPMTSPAMTSHPMTFHAMTSHAMASPTMTSHATASPTMTFHSMTSHPMPSPAMTSPAMTSHVMTSHALTSPAMTSHAMTSPAMTSHVMTSPAMTSHVMTSCTSSASNISQNLPRSRRSSVISMANSPMVKAQHSQLHVSSTEHIQTRVYFPREASLSVRQNHNNNQLTWQPIKMDNKYTEIGNPTNSEHIFAQLKRDHMLAKNASLSPYHRELARKANITSSSLNYHSASNGIRNGISNGPVALYTQQQVLRSENQHVPFELVSNAEPHQSLGCFNVFNHVPELDVANENRHYLHTNELANGTDCSTLVQVQGVDTERNGKLSDLSNLHLSSQAKIHEADHFMQMRIFSNGAEDTTQTREFPNRTEDCGQTFQIPYEVEDSSESCEFLNETENSSQPCEFSKGEGDSAQTSELSNEPLDLSLPKERKRTQFCTEEVSIDLTSEDTEPVVEMSSPSTEASVRQPSMSIGEHISVSPVVTTHRPLNNTPSEVASSMQTIGQNKDLFVSSNISLTQPRNSMLNSLPIPESSARHQGICHKSPLLETALRHNIISKDKDPHPFNTVVPECHITQPSSSDEPECRPLPNNQIDYKALHASQTASLQPPKLLSSTSSAVPANGHSCFVTSATVISLPVSQSSQSLMSLLANTAVTKHTGCSPNKQTGQHPSALPTTQEKQTSGLTIQQPSSNSQSSYSYTSYASRHPLNNVVVSVGSASPKVVPLPVKDFFTHTAQDNTYSALLMARITNKNKQGPGYQQVNELLRNYRSQNRGSLEIGNQLQRRVVIDLTDSDDDCKLLPISPQENPARVLRTINLRVTSKNLDSRQVPETADSCASETTNSHKQTTKDLYSTGQGCASGFSTTPCNLTDQMYLENALPVNTANNNHSGVPDVYIMDVESGEPYHNQEQNETDQSKFHQNMSNTENSVPTKKVSTPRKLQTDKPGESLHQSSNYIHSHTVNENADKTARTTSSRVFSSCALDLKIDSPGRELMAKKLQSALSMRTHPEELTQRIFPLPLTHGNNEEGYTETQQSPVCSFEERVQTSTSTTVHDNSTQHAAATLLELSANPIYNPHSISPESCGDFQEKVYQIHPVFSEEKNNKWDTTKDVHNNRINVQPSQSFSVARTTASKNRSSRRVGRPPKDQYSSSHSVTSVKSQSLSANNTIPSSASNSATTIMPGVLREAKLLHSVTPYGCSNVIVHPQNVAFESQKLIASIEPDKLSGMFHFNYDFTTQNQQITKITEENQSTRGNYESHSQARNILKSSGDYTNSSPQFREMTFASVASKTSSDMIFSNTAFQAMTRNHLTHLSNGLYVVHNSNTGTLFSKSPPNNISALESIPRGQSASGGSAEDHKNPNHSAAYSLPSASIVSNGLISNNPVVASVQECNSSTDKRSKVRKRKYQSCNSEEDKIVQSHSISAEAVPNTDVPSACLTNTCMSAEDLTTQKNNSNEYLENSKNSKKKRTPKGRGRKRKSKAKNKNSKISHLENADEEDLAMNGRNPQENRVNTRQPKKGKKPEKFFFQDDDDQTIQYGLDNLQMTDNFVPVSSSSAGLPVSDHLLWNTTMVSGGMSISDGMSNMDKNEHQKELEVTSLLAFMMCNKYKGQV